MRDFALKYGISDPQTDAYFAFTKTEPAGHCSISGFGDGSTASLSVHYSVQALKSARTTTIGCKKTVMLVYSHIWIDQPGSAARTVQRVSISDP